MKSYEVSPGMKVYIKNPNLRDIDGKSLFMKTGVFLGIDDFGQAHRCRRNTFGKVRMDDRAVLTDHFYIKDLQEDRYLDLSKPKG